MDPVVRLSTFDDAKFERFVWEWVNGYVAKHFAEVQHRGAAGDKGRDVIAWLDDSAVSPRRWRLYQCKRYKDPLAPGDFLVELGKLCYYSMRGDYTVPEFYYIVAPNGVGNSLQDLIDDPPSLKQRLIDKWDEWCRTKITSTKEVKLEGTLLTYVQQFDFSIVKTMDPKVLIEQHKETKYHLPVFGASFKPRPLSTLPPSQVTPVETIYVSRVYEAFADHLKVAVAKPEDFVSHSHLKSCFNHARECFYSAESLKEFSRDNLPDDTAYVNLCKQVKQGVTATLNKDHKDGYDKLVDVTEKVVTVEITSNILVSEVEPSDKVGLCHHLANEGSISWVIK